MRFNEILTELFDNTSVDYVEHSVGNDINYTFGIGDIGYIVYFVKDYEDEIYTLSFTMDEKSRQEKNIDSKYSPSGTGNQIKVINTVFIITLEFLKEKQPDGIDFSGNTSSGQGPLYAKIIKKLAPKIKSMGYSVSTENDHFDHRFSIIKDED